MTRQEFKKEFDKLHGRYPGFVMPQPTIVMGIYYNDLQRFSLQTFRIALPEILRVSPQFFPACGVVKGMCESAEVAQEMQGHIPRRRFHPAEHDCKLVGKQEMNRARRLLFEVAPYEGYHAPCQGDIHPVCPECGIIQQPFINPFIVSLMDQYPDDSECWNPLHKGTLLCHVCEVIDGPGWIKKLYDRRVEARK